MNHRKHLDGDVNQVKSSGAVFSKWGSLCDLFEHAELIDREQSIGVLLMAAENNLSVGEFLAGSGAMSPALVRAGILCQLAIRDQLMPLNVATEALRMCAIRKLSLEECLDMIGWNRKYFEHLKLSCCLLLDAEIIDKQDRDTLLEIAVLQNLPLVQVIENREIIDRQMADVCLNLESLVYSDTIAYAMAVDLLRTCFRKKVTLESAIESIEMRDLAKKVKVRLGGLLIASSMVSTGDLLACVEISLVYRRLLGEVLVEQGVLTEKELKEVLETQRKLWDGSHSMNMAISYLRSLRRSPEPEPGFF